MTQLNQLVPQDDKFKSILVPLAKDVKELHEIFENRASTSERLGDVYTILANELMKTYLALQAVYPQEVKQPKTHLRHAMGRDMATLVLALNRSLDGISNTEQAIHKTARNALLCDPEYAPYRDAFFNAAQKFVQELVRSGIDIQDLTEAKFHGLRDALSYASPSKPPSRGR